MAMSPDQGRNREIRLVARPRPQVTAALFELGEGPVPEPGPGEALIRVRYLSLEPAMRGWISDAPNYREPLPLGEVMFGFTIGQVAASLALLPGSLSFLASLQLRTHVLWAGKLRASWVPAVARGAGGRRRAADRYKLVLRSGQEPTFVSSVTVGAEQTVHDFTGVELGQMYTVSLTCVFGERQFDCGTSFLSTSPPALVVGNTVYTQVN